MKTRSFLALSLFLLLLPAACQSEPPNKADHDALAACGQSSCADGDVYALEGGVSRVRDMRCIVEKMRDRSSGVYVVKVEHDHTIGSDSGDVTVFVTPSGEAELAVHRKEAVSEDEGEQSSGHEETWEPTRRCTLKPASFFDACLEGMSEGGAGDGEGAEQWDTESCILSESAISDLALPWFESCQDLAPTCE